MAKYNEHFKLPLVRQYLSGTVGYKFKVAGEKLYPAPILDLYNGEILAFETSERPVFDMASSML